jgi:hypothetical protein
MELFFAFCILNNKRCCTDGEEMRGYKFVSSNGLTNKKPLTRGSSESDRRSQSNVVCEKISKILLITVEGVVDLLSFPSSPFEPSASRHQRWTMDDGIGIRL